MDDVQPNNSPSQVNRVRLRHSIGDFCEIEIQILSQQFKGSKYSSVRIGTSLIVNGTCACSLLTTILKTSVSVKF